MIKYLVCTPVLESNMEQYSSCLVEYGCVENRNTKSCQTDAVLRFQNVILILKRTH